MPILQPVPATNRLIAALPLKNRLRFLARCTPIKLVFAEILARPGEHIRHVYFPTDSFISLVSSHDSRASLEVGLVGDEGMLGTSMVLGVNVSPLCAVVRKTGLALRMSASDFRHELDSNPLLQRELKRYLHVLMNQLAQTAICTHFHVVEARLARCFLMMQDRAHSDAVHATHEHLAQMLGVRRVGITKAATALQNRKLISYNRGAITILDRRGLETASCDCYKMDQAEYKGIMG